MTKENFLTPRKEADAERNQEIAKRFQELRAAAPESVKDFAIFRRICQERKFAISPSWIRTICINAGVAKLKK